MAVKTITVTTAAYDALKYLKGRHESFSETILRVTKRRSLWEFAGAISEASAAKLEAAIKESRTRHTESHRKRIARMAAQLRS
ncbi:antitoxin VapB family protein [Candidatus Woesearchaeota archaeon]|nr:antitoxin VapB family protein [Candidatus Woesearchaeota archaeon]